VISDKPCNLRIIELELVSYKPPICHDPNKAYDKCDELTAYARYNIKQASQSDALFQLLTTIFTCIIMTIGSLMFSSDTDKIIIEPITKMVGIIKQLADDPLQKPEVPIFTDEEINSKAKNQLKTVELQKTIFRIGKLLQMCFG